MFEGLLEMPTDIRYPSRMNGGKLTRSSLPVLRSGSDSLETTIDLLHDQHRNKPSPVQWLRPNLNHAQARDVSPVWASTLRNHTSERK